MFLLAHVSDKKHRKWRGEHRTDEDFPGASAAKTRLRVLSSLTPNAGGLGSIPAQGTRSHLPQRKIPSAATKVKDPMCINSDPVQPNK